MTAAAAAAVALATSTATTALGGRSLRDPYQRAGVTNSGGCTTLERSAQRPIPQTPSPAPPKPVALRAGVGNRHCWQEWSLPTGGRVKDVVPRHDGRGHLGGWAATAAGRSVRWCDVRGTGGTRCGRSCCVLQAAAAGQAESSGGGRGSRPLTVPGRMAADSAGQEGGTPRPGRPANVTPNAPRTHHTPTNVLLLLDTAVGAPQPCPRSRALPLPPARNGASRRFTSPTLSANPVGLILPPQPAPVSSPLRAHRLGLACNHPS